MAFRGVDRSQLTESEEEDLELDDEQLESVARPFAHVATKSTFLSKHGRMIIDSKDALEASVVLFMWSNRVRRIAKSHKPAKENRNNGRVSRRPNVQEPEQAEQPQESPNGQFVGRPAIGTGFN